MTRTYWFLKPSKLGNTSILGEYLDLVPSCHTHPLNNVEIGVTDVKRLATLAILEVEAIRLYLQLPWVLILGRHTVCLHWKIHCSAVFIVSQQRQRPCLWNSQMLLFACALYFDSPCRFALKPRMSRLSQSRIESSCPPVSRLLDPQNLTFWTERTTFFFFFLLIQLV